MREAVHIFLKDSRQARYPIIIALAWTAILALAGLTPLHPYQPTTGWLSTFWFLVPIISTVILPVAWWYLISQAFHAEALPGDRQFWLTRPYHRGSLFGAKALFVLVYITVPMALAQTAIVVLQGFPLGPNVIAIVWSQILILAVIVLPAAALATLTSTLAQFLTAGLAAPLLFLANRLLPPWLALEWIRSAVAIAVIVAVTTAVLFIQFSRRRTGASRLVALGGILMLVVILPLLSWRAAFALQARGNGGSAENVRAELARPEVPASKPGVTRPTRLSFRVLGPASGTPIACDAVQVDFTTPEKVWSTGLQRLNRVVTVSTMPAGCDVLIPATLSRVIADRQVDLHAVLYITVFDVGQTTAVPIDEPPTFVPNAGLCQGARLVEDFNFGAERVESRRTVAGCLTAFRDQPGIPSFSSSTRRTARTPGRSTYSPFPADLRIMPVEDGGFDYFNGVDTVTVTAQRPVAHVKTVVDVPGVLLLDFQ